MTRRARLTVLELGASSLAWAACHELAPDDWIVVAQQSDEAAVAFTQRVRQRAQRLRREDAQLDLVDVYAGPGNDQLTSAARREVVEELGTQMATGGQLTLWSGPGDRHGDAELSAILAQFGPILAERQIAMQHQACEPNARSGVRHVAPLRAPDSELDFEDFG